MNIYEKLQKARVELQSRSLKKSGENKFAKYLYYELSDILPTINQIFNEAKLFSKVSFDKEIAMLTIFNIEKPDEQIMFTSPMASAQLKGCHEIQNLGAVETYQRRYLYMTALEIVEHDALDATTGQDKPKKEQAKKEPPKQEVSPQMKKMFAVIRELNIEGKEKVKEFIESRINRQISSTKEMTEKEVSKVIEDATKMKEEL